MGLVIGLLAAVAQAWFRVYPPAAYGVCMVGHPRDLVNWVANRALGWSAYIAQPSLEFPLLTAVGVLLGSAIAASTSERLRLRAARPSEMLSAFAFGFVVANFGLLLGECPIRVLLMTAYGDPLGALGVVSIVIGVFLACAYLRRVI